MANLNTGSDRAALKERGDDLYETPRVAIEALLRHERLPHYLWEPACGPGAIVDVLRAHGHECIASDLVDYGNGTSFWGRDFLMEYRAPANCQCIITNPPFKLANEFVGHALSLCPKVVMLLRLAFLESQRRSAILDSGQLARVYVFRNRLPMMHRSGRGTKVAKTNSSALPFAWFVWERDWNKPAELRRISWEPLAGAACALSPQDVALADMKES